MPTREQVTESVKRYVAGETAIVPCLCYKQRLHGRLLADCGLECIYCLERHIQKAWALNG